jgi:hypothetical protein
VFALVKLISRTHLSFGVFQQIGTKSLSVKFICKLIFDPSYVNSNTCQLCGALLYDFFTHVICSCSSTYATCTCICNTLWTDQRLFLKGTQCVLPNDELYLILLDRKTNFLLDDNDPTIFKHLNF